MKGFIVFLIMLLSCGKIFSQNTFAETDGVYIGAGFNVGWGSSLGNEQGLLHVIEFKKQKFMNSTFDELLDLLDIPHTKGSGWYDDKKLKVEQLLERQQLLQQTDVSRRFSDEDVINIIKAWESLPGDRSYTPREISNWLQRKMSPAINRLRAVLNGG